MKMFDKFIASALALLAMAACAPELEMSSITLEASNTEILADATETVSFTVTSDLGDDVTGKALIMCVTDNSIVKNAEFSTSDAGTYTFVASLNGIKSNEITINATSIDGENPGENPGDGEDGETEWVTSKYVTPIRYAEQRYYGTSTSTGIDIVKGEAGVLRFVCTPGSEVKSYRVQFYSMSYIYNVLCEQLNAKGVEKLTVEDAEQVIFSLMTNYNYEALCGKLMNSSIESLGSEYYSYEFDWLNMDHSIPWQIQADADYLVVTLSSFEETCAVEDSYADMAICHFHTPAMPLTGDPKITIEPDPSYASYKCTYTGNADCKYMFYLSHDTGSIEQYINLYGEKMYRDFLRHYGSAIDMSQPYLSTTSQTDILDGEKSYTATAIALDVNGVPAEKITRVDFQLKEKPAEQERPLAKASIKNIVAASNLAKFHVEMDANTYCIYQGIYTKEEAEAYMNADQTTKDNLQYKLSTEGWGHANLNFKFDKDKGVLPESAAYTDKEGYWMDLKQEKEYAIIYITCNGYGDLSELQMSEVFKTKKQIRAISPTATYDPTFKFNLTSPNVTTLNYEFEFNPDIVAQFYFGCYYPLKEGDGAYDGFEYPNESSNRDTWMYWMLDFRDPQFSTPWANAWATVDTKGGRESSGLSGFEPGSHYKYACVYETWDGYISEVIFSEATTQNVNWGPNPKVSGSFTEKGGAYDFKFTGNTDVGSIKYMSMEYTNSLASLFDLDYLYLAKNANPENYYLGLAEKQLLDIGLESKGNFTGMNVNANTLAGNKIVVVVAMGIGEAEGLPVYSDVVYYVWTDKTKKFQTLHEYLSE